MKGETETKTYEYVINNFMGCVIGRNQWRKECFEKTISEMLSVSDEAFCIWVIENQARVWMYEYKYRKELNDDTVDPESLPKKPKALFTVCRQRGSGKQCVGGQVFSGWSDEGVERWNDLSDLVRAAREIQDRKNFEKSYLAHMKKKYCEAREDPGKQSDKFVKGRFVTDETEPETPMSFLDRLNTMKPVVAV